MCINLHSAYIYAKADLDELKHLPPCVRYKINLVSEETKMLPRDECPFRLLAINIWQQDAYYGKKAYWLAMAER